MVSLHYFPRTRGGSAWINSPKKHLAVTFLFLTIPFTLLIGPAQSQIVRCSDRIPPQIQKLLMMQNGKSYDEGWQQQGSQGTPSLR